MRKILFIAFLVASIVGCKKNKKGTPEPIKIGKAELSFPLKDETCNTGIVLSDKESKITFKWNAAQNAESYDLTVKNLLSGTSILQSTSKTEIELTLSRNTPYSWNVTSKSSQASETIQSDTWKFYNAGPGNLSYAPFPAEAVSPTNNQTIAPVSGKVTLDWSSVDVDNDIKDYDVYIGTTSTPALLKVNVVESLLDNITVNANTTYYWKIITRDLKGNTSESDVFLFKTN